LKGLWKTLGNADDLAEIERRVGTLIATDAARWGRMQCGQMVCHTTDSFRGALGEIAADKVKIPVPRGVMKWFALRAPMRWPKGVPTVPELDQAKGRGTQPGDFAADRACLLGEMKRFSESRGPWREHPFFGPMSQGDWMRWGYLHMDHHLRQFGR
jgi:hypothetical protein